MCTGVVLIAAGCGNEAGPDSGGVSLGPESDGRALEEECVDLWNTALGGRLKAGLAIRQASVAEDSEREFERFEDNRLVAHVEVAPGRPCLIFYQSIELVRNPSAAGVSVFVEGKPYLSGETYGVGEELLQFLDLPADWKWNFEISMTNGTLASGSSERNAPAPEASAGVPQGPPDVCSPSEQDGVRIVRAGSALGCGKIGDLASRTVSEDGFLDVAGFYCRWGQGGSTEQIVDGEPYLPGLCTRGVDGVEVDFLARRINESG